MDVKREKHEVRMRVYRALEASGVALPPKPIAGRIPNFKGAAAAARRLAGQGELIKARVVFCNPDSPQRPLRELLLRRGKTLVMATPRLARGFILLTPGMAAGRYRLASTIRGAFKVGRLIQLDELPQVDVKVTGSVAVTERGDRLGKGHGYSELEYAILREVGAVSEETPVATTVHDLQVVEHIPAEPHDITVDLIATPIRLIEARGEVRRPKGVMWELLDERYLNEIPVLMELRKRAAHPEAARKLPSSTRHSHSG